MPLGVIYRYRISRSAKQLSHSASVALGILSVCWHTIFCERIGFDIPDRRAYHFLNAITVLLDHRIMGNVFLKQGAGKLAEFVNGPHVVLIIAASDCRAGAYHAEFALGNLEPFLQTANQTGNIGPLGTVIGVQLV